MLNNNNNNGTATAPQFSIILPSIATAGRINSLKKSIQSVLQQTYDNFELIVSDNSIDGRVKHIIDQLKPNLKIRYIRPDQILNLPDHYEFASSHAAGEWVLMLQDRLYMLPNALKKIHDEIARFPNDIQAICCPHGPAFDYRTGKLSVIDYFSDNSELKKSRALVEAFAQFTIKRELMPHVSNNFYHHNLAQEIRSRHGRLFTTAAISPDDSAGFLQLAYTDKILFIDRPIWIGHISNEGNSNGGYCTVNGMKSYLESIKIYDFFEKVPIPVDCVLNCTIYDLMTIKALAGHNLDTAELNINKYSIAIYKELIIKESTGCRMDFATAYKKWRNFVKHLPDEQRVRILNGIKKKEYRQHPCLGMFRRFLAYTKALRFLRILKSNFNRYYNTNNWSHLRYNNILDAAKSIEHKIIIKS